MVLAARARLCARVVDHELLHHDAMARLERLLLARLTALCARALLLELAARRAARLSPLERMAVRTVDASAAVYEEFCDGLRRGGLAGFFREYPVLERLTRRVAELWADATAELLERLDHDHGQMERVFGELGQVVSAEPGLSDPHRGGRMVTGLTFASGRKLAYKPKHVGSERSFNRLLQWLGERGAPLPFRVLTLLTRPEYGWVEWVEHEPCLSAEDGHRYYQRAGMLVCLVYALVGTDCHQDNLIAAGEHPVLVDVECLMHHRPHLEHEPTGAVQLALEALTGGVLGTGLLPSWQMRTGARAGPASDISALHTPAAFELVQEMPRWERLNRDGMELRRGPVKLALPKSQPLLGDRPLRLENHASDVLDGFARFYDFLLEQRPALLAPSSPLHELFRQPVRFLYRSTRVYGELQRQLCDPAYLREENDRRRELGRLADAGTGPRPDCRWLPLIDAERQALEEVDVPLFTARADETTLTLAPGCELEGCVREPSAKLVMERLRGLEANDRQQQLGFIAGSLYANTAHHEMSAAPPSSPVRSGRPGRSLGLEDAATAIAAEIAGRAVRSPVDGGATWIAPQYLPQLKRYQLQPIGYDLHSGACGIALFLSAVELATGSGDHGRLALQALQPFRRALGHGGEGLADSLALGAAPGLGSVVYALVRIAALLDQPSLLEDAAAAASLLTDDRIAAAPADVFEGLAGEILGLLTLHSAAPDSSALARATACGRLLVNARSAGASGRRAWVTVDDRMLTGFSHGAAGIAYALLRLHTATGGESFRSAAAEAIEYEDHLFDEEASNWPDLREDEQPAFKANWCHGAPGIGLARVGGLAAIDTPKVRADIEAAVRATLRVDLERPDHLCCGNVGRAEFLLAAGERLGRPELSDAARERVGEVARRAHAAGGFRLNAFLPRVFMPGFFMGTAGIGYELLRSAYSTDLPSVLLWE